MKIIRWGGLVAFLLIVTLLFIVTHFFMDAWIKAGIETFASKAVGAEVNVGRVAHSYSPFGVQINGLQVTDAEQPSHNKVQLENLEAKLALSPLFMGKVIIDDLSAEGIQFGTLRGKPGKLYGDEPEPAEPSAAEKSGMPDLDVELPSVDSLMNKYPLKTQQAGEALKQSYSKHDANLNEQFKALPDEKALEQYQTQIEALTEGKYSDPQDLLAAQKKLKKLKDELKAEKKKIDDFKQSVSAATQELQDGVKQLEAAPEQDLDKFKGLIGGDLASISGVTELIFGEQAKVWAERLFAAYDFLIPFLQSSDEQVEEKQRQKGYWIEFAETRALPKFLVRNASLSLLLEGESIESRWKDITSEHDILGRATEFTVSSSEAKRWQQLAINGDFWIGEEGVDAKQSWVLKALNLEQLPLEFDQVISGQLEKALMDSEGSLAIEKGLLDGKGLIDLSQLVVDAKGEGKMGKSIADVLMQIDTLAMSAIIGGELASPSLGLSSDLDSKLGDLLSSSLGEEGQKHMAELQGRLNNIAAEPLGGSSDKLTDWQQWQDLADGKSDNVEKLLKADIDSAINKEKDKLEEQLRKRLFN